jgi:hypothetical protein
MLTNRHALGKDESRATAIGSVLVTVLVVGATITALLGIGQSF